jgi:putative oxidoreductase
MMSVLFGTDDDYAAFIARLVLGAVMFPHGAQKLLGWFGGNGFSGTMAFFTGQMGLPWIIAFLVIMIEFFGALGLIGGLLSRVNALGIGAVMLGAIFTSHAQYGFFMNWYGNKAGEGFEYHLLALGLAAVVLLKGGGAWAVDRLVK